jgi:MFS family permease
MKTTARPIIRWLGFKPVLVINTLITALSFMSYSLFRADTWSWLIIATLLVGGFFRSLQFTALNAIAFADVSPAQMSRASSLSSMGQQLAQSIGIGVAAILLELIRGPHGSGALKAADVSPTFFIIGVISLAALFFFLPLAKDAGAEVSGKIDHRADTLAHAED